MQLLLRASVIATSLLALASCSSFEFEEQALALRHVAQDDALELRIVYLGLNPGDAKPADAAATLAGISAGAKHFLIADWPLDFGPEYFEAIEDSESDAAEIRFVRWIEDFQVVESGAYTEYDGRLCVWQLLRFPRFSVGLDLISRTVDEHMLENLGGEEPDPPFGDPGLIPRYMDTARKGDHPWASFVGGALRIALPISPAGMAGMVRAFAPGPGLDRDLMDGILPALSTGECRDGQAVLRFEPDEAGWIHFGFAFSDRSASAELAKEVLATVPAAEPPAWVRELARRTARSRQEEPR